MDKELQKIIVDNFLPYMSLTDKERCICGDIFRGGIEIKETAARNNTSVSKARKAKYKFIKNCKIAISNYLERMALLENHLNHIKESYEGCKKANIAMMTELKNITSE